MQVLEPKRLILRHLCIDDAGFIIQLLNEPSFIRHIGDKGLVRREDLDDADIGFAMLEQHWSKGYAAESAEAVMRHARKTLNLQRIVAIVAPDNRSSIRLLEKIGLTFERMIRRGDDDKELKFFVSDAQ